MDKEGDDLAVEYGFEVHKSQRSTSYKKGLTHIWRTGYFSNSTSPFEPSEWIDRWTASYLIHNHFINHRVYNSLEEALANER